MRSYIAVAGNIGAGKTSLVDFLRRRYGVKAVFEPHRANPYLADFYKDMRRWAFHSQIYFLTHKFRLHRELEKYPGTVIQDRTIYEDAEIFARNLHRSRYLTKREFSTYWELYQAILKELAPPDVMIFLSCSVRTMRKRIRQRGRGIERNIPARYLRNLQRLYQQWITGYKLSPVITIDSDRLDYITNLVDRLDLLARIEKYL